MADNTALYVSIGSLVVSIIAVVTAVVTARQAKRQARQHAALPPASEAINHLRRAEAEIRTTRAVNPIAVDSMRAAKVPTDLVFNEKVRGELNRLIGIADRIRRERREGRDSDREDIKALLAELQSLIARMNELATLR